MNNKSNFTTSFCFLPKPKRQAMQALYNYCRHIDDIVDETEDQQKAQHELNHWRKEINNLYQGNPTHPIAKALQTPIQQYDLPQAWLEELIDGMEMDLKQTRYQRWKDLELYCYRAASVVGQLTACILGYQNKQTLKYAYNLGICLQLINIIRDVGEDATRGRIYLPIEECIKHGVNPQDITTKKHTPELEALLQTQTKRARQYYQNAIEKLPKEDRNNQKIGLMMANTYLQLLKKIEKKSYPVLTQRLKLTKPHKLTILLKTYISEKIKHLLKF